MSERLRDWRQPWLWLTVLVLLLLLLMRVGWWQGTGVGAQVQIPMFYDAHYLFPRPWTQTQEAPGVPEPDAISVLYGPNVVTQPLVVGMGQLGLVEVWLAGEVNTAVLATVSNQSGESYQAEILLADDAWQAYWLRLPAGVATEGAVLQVRLAAPTATVEAPVSTRSVGGDRLGGSLALNEYQRPANLALQTYAQGWPGLWWSAAIGEQLLPETFQLRVQQYKPEPFKGGVFAALVFVTVLLSVVFLFLAQPTAVTNQRFLLFLGWGLVGLVVVFLGWQVADDRLRLGIPTIEMEAVSRPVPTQLAEARLVHDFTSVLWAAAREPEERFIQVDLVDGQAAIQVPADSRIEFVMAVPPNGRLRSGVVALGEGETQFRVLWNGSVIAETVGTEAVQWLDVDLSPWQGQSGALELITTPMGEGTPPEVLQGMWVMAQVTAVADWLLPTPLPDDEAITLADHTFAGVARLLGYQAVVLEGQLEVTLYWQAQTPTQRQGTVFVHLLDGDGEIISQHDGQPVNNSYPMPNWLPDVIIEDVHLLPLPSGVSEIMGTGQLGVGIYDPATFTRWEVDGADAADSRILLPLP